MTDPLDVERLLAHSGWVWRLARSVVADDPTADDVLQDTLVAALERPPRTEEPGTSLRAWLSTVAHRLALRRARSDARRNEREHLSAKSIELPPVDRVVERESARRDLVEHVLALDDAYRDTILLRFFDDLTPLEIARRLGVPDSTVRNRLRRGLAQLHERLERERGEEWKQWCLLLAPVGSGGTQTPLFSLPGWTAGLLAMGTKVALLLVAAAGALATIFSWHALHPVEAAPMDRPAIATDSAAHAASADRTAAESAHTSERIAQGPRLPAENRASAEDPTGILCFGAVRSKEGVAVTSGTIWIEDPIGRKRECNLDARGWYSFAGIIPGRWTLRAGCDGFRPFDTAVDLTADRSADRHDLVLESATLLNVRIRMASANEPLSLRAYQVQDQARLTVVATRDTPPANLSEIAGRSHYVYGIGKYQWRESFGGRSARIPEGYDGVLEVHEPLPCCVSLVLRHIVIESKVVPLGATEIEFVVDPDTRLRLLAQARIQVVDAQTGAPLASANVALNPSDTGGGGVTADADGIANLVDLLPGPLELSIHAKDHAWFQRSVEIEPGRLNDLGTLRVSRSCRVTGRVVDNNGTPISVGITWIDAEAAARPDRFRPYHSARTDSTGRFVFDGVPRGKLILWSEPYGQEWAHACAVMDTTAGNLEGVEMRLERGRAIGLVIEGAQVEHSAWILRQADGVPLFTRNWFERGPIPLCLADGSYQVEVWCDGSLVRTQEFRVSRDDELFHVKL